MAIIEKKYILNQNARQLLKSNNANPEIVSQFYTSIKLCKEVRFRKVNNKFFKTIRTGSDVRKNLINKKISKLQYKKAKHKKISKILKKYRYKLKIEEKNYVLDEYKKHLENLYLLEVSFDSLDEATNFKIPINIKKYIISDVSTDNRYRNKNLSLLGNPKKNQYDIYTIFKNLEKKRLKSLEHILFNEMLVSDAIRLVLYKIFQDLKHDKEHLISSNSIIALTNFKQNISRSITILNEFKFLFKKDIFKKVYQHLIMVQRNISVDKDVHIMKYNMNILEVTFNNKEIIKFLYQIDNKIENRKSKVTKFLQTREFNIIFKQYYLLLKEPNNVNPKHYDNTSIRKEIQKLIKHHFKKSKKLINKYEKCYDIDGYKKIKTSIFKIRILLEEFKFIYEQTKYLKMHNIIKKIEDELFAYIEAERESLIIKAYIKDNSKNLQKQNRLIQRVKTERKEIQKISNLNIEETFKTFKKSKTLFNS